MNTKKPLSLANALLEDIADLKYGKGLPKRDRRPGYHPVYGSGGIVDYHNVALVKGPGIIVGRKGSIGTVFYEKNDFYPIDTVFYVVARTQKLDLYYLSKLLETIGLRNLNTDAAVPGLNRNVALKQPISVASYPIQRKIASILSAYDDLIENNLKRIKILEEMAQNLYREWFVKFRFPWHENVRFVDSPLGKIPEGWEVKKLKDECCLTMGMSPKSKYYNLRSQGLPFHQGVSNFGGRYPSTRQFCSVKGRIAVKGDILFSVRAPVGRINIADTKMVIGRGLSSIQHKGGKQHFLFYQLKQLFQDEDSMGGGTIFKSVTKSDMESIKLISPCDSLMSFFEKSVTPLEESIEVFFSRISILRRTRDLLLPKLISGEIDVSDLEIKIQEEANNE